MRSALHGTRRRDSRRPLGSMPRPLPVRILMVAAVPFVIFVLVIGLLGAVLVQVGGAGVSGEPILSAPTGALAVPGPWLEAERRAAESCPESPWYILGALGWLASRSGRLPIGRPPPWWGWDGGVFGVVADPSPRRLSVTRAAREAEDRMCGAIAQYGSLAEALRSTLGSSSSALEVEVLSLSLSDRPHLQDADARAIDFAVHALGISYAWGGNGPQSYDCSGLIVAAERSAGRRMPRTAQAQHDVARIVRPPGQAGDLAFFGASARSIGHVGLIIGGQLMIDAPHAGAVVRIEPYSWSELIDEGAPS